MEWRRLALVAVKWAAAAVMGSIAVVRVLVMRVVPAMIAGAIARTASVSAEHIRDPPKISKVQWRDPTLNTSVTLVKPTTILTQAALF